MCPSSIPSLQVRRYDWISRFESGVKRRITAAEPTVVQPQRYRERLCHAVERYFGFPPTKFTSVAQDRVPAD
jgi:hypothetical protein